MRMHKWGSARLARLGVGVVALGAITTVSVVWAYGFDDDEQAFEFAYLSTPIAIEGRIVDDQGQALPDAQIRLIGFGEGIINDGEATTSWWAGSFELAGLARRNVLLAVELPGYYTEIIPVDLQRPIDEDVIELPDIELVAEQFGTARLSFAGDAMFGRRMFDHGLLAKPTLEADTRALFRYVQPVLEVDDHTAINLETPVTDQLWTPHPSKEFVFNAYPASAAALTKVGVDSVSLGNNHVYDYLSIGMLDTLAQLDAIGLPHYGAGIDASDAAASVHRPTIHGVEIALQGFCDISGASHGKTSLELIAHDHPSKPGALHSSAAEIDAFVTHEVAAGRAAIPIFHGGAEYEWSQTFGLRTDIEDAVAAGATLVVAHHPHVVHGVSLVDAGEGPRWVFGSLGNFVFDQEVFETLRSYIAVVDLVDGGAGPTVDRVRLVPMVRDDYVPRLLVGDALAEFGRAVAQLSMAEAERYGGVPPVVFAEAGRLVVASSGAGLSSTDIYDARTVALEGGRTGVVALEPFTPTDALVEIRSARATRCELGLDRLAIGGFEDPDVDDRANEGDGWVLDGSRRIQGLEVHSGAAALVMLRHASQASPTTLTLGRRIAVTPGRELTVHGWLAGDNLGIVRLRIRWLRGDGSLLAIDSASPTTAQMFAWSSFEIDRTIPKSAAAVIFELELNRPKSGEARLFVDDLSIIEWDRSRPLNDGTLALTSPNGWGFVRCEGSGSELAMTLVHRAYTTHRRVYQSRLRGLPTRIRARAR